MRNIEKFIIWYVLASLLELLLISLFVPVLKGFAQVTGDYQPYYDLLPVIVVFIKYLDNLVCGVWLARFSDEEVVRKPIWCLFGLSAGLLSVIIYLVMTHLLTKNDSDQQVL